MGKTICKKFDGKRYYCHLGMVDNKTNAEKKAEKARKGGHNARVIPHGSYYRVFVEG